MKNTLVVNLIAAPSSGKSTIMAQVFAKLKWLNVDCEMVTEFAKELVWEERKETFKDELYIFAKQAHRLFRVNGKVDVIITDRPLIITVEYNNRYGDGLEELDALCIKEFNKYNNLNFFLERNKPYNPNGRNETEEQSNEIAKELKEILDVNNIPYINIAGVESASDLIVEEILKRI